MRLPVSDARWGHSDALNELATPRTRLNGHYLVAYRTPQPSKRRHGRDVSVHALILDGSHLCGIRAPIGLPPDVIRHNPKPPAIGIVQAVDRVAIGTGNKVAVDATGWFRYNVQLARKLCFSQGPNGKCRPRGIWQ